jgi:FXSXX-COOH protein
MGEILEDSGAAAVPGVEDTRALALDQLAGRGVGSAARSLRHVLPEEDARRVAVAAFGSTI